jgi:Ca2+-binding RTX toxin-like protein
VITTGAGADTITTGSGDDIVNTGGGVDFVNAGAGNDTLDGGAGNDTLNGEGGDDTLISDRGNDQLNGGAGLDTLVLAYGDATGAVAYFSGPSSDGSGGLNGGIFESGGGRQVAFNAIERFVITTGAGADTITTGTGNDVVITGAGHDSVDVRSGTDSADGGAGEDMISADLSDAAGAIVWNLQTNSFSGGPDSFINFEYFGTITTGAGDDVITTSALRKSEVMNTGGGNDTVTVLAGNDTFNAGAGFDTLIVAWGDAIGGVAFFSGPSSDGSGGFNGGIFESTGNRQVAFTSVERFIITSGAGGDSLTTGTGDDVVNTGDGDDFVDVRTGADSSDGGAGLDGISADLSDASGAVIWNLQTNSFSGGPDSFANFEYFGTITTGAGNDVITTSAFGRNEVINTGAGNDTVTVVAGVDQVNAGTGFDTLVLAWGGATGAVGFYSGPSASGDGGFNGGLFENGGGSRQVGFQSIERFVITTGSGNDTIVGASGDDEIRTGAGNDTLNGGEGDDYLDGGTGADAMTGGRGSDTFVVDDAGDTVIEQAGQGIDTVETALAAYTLAANVENIAGAGMAQALTGNALNNGMLGTLGDDTLSGGAGDDVIVGSLGADLISGGEGRDILVAGLIDPTNLIVNGSFETQDGANSARQFILDDGDDYNGVTYRFASTLFGWTRSGADGGDIELNTYGTNGGFDRGNGSVVLDLEVDPGENVSIYQEVAGLPGGSALILSFAAGQATGGSLGANPSATLEVVWNGVVVATIVSTSTAMTQHAFVVTASGTGQDRLEFRETGAGADARGTALDAVALNFITPGFDGAANTLVGGSGGDTLLGDVGNDSLRGDQGADLLVGGEGVDTVDYARESGDLALVNLSSATVFLGGLELAAGTARDTHGFRDTLVGVENVSTGSGDDQVLGGSGANDISTGGGNDQLNGGDGADTLAGGAGDDTYTDDDADADTINERENEGTDTVRTSQAVYSIAAIAHVENLTGTADAGQTLTGNAADNIVSGGAGDDRLAGGAGNDTLNGNGGDDTLVYNGLGNDPAHGGAGTDTLVVDFSGATASIVDNPNAGGFGFEASYWDRGANSVAFTSIERIQITTGAFADTITTFGGNDEIRTGAGADTLNGGGGDDLLDGGADADAMSGGSGNDIYIVDNLSDVVTENEEDGTDEVRTALGGKGSASELYVLAANVENLTGTSSSAQGVRGNALNNIITMGRGADLVVADDGGNDTITTGAGNDFIYFGNAFTAQDRVDGGAGTDTVGLLGSYDLTLVEGSLAGIERLALYTGQPGTGGVANSYVITTADASVAAGAQLFITAASLAASEAFTFNGTAESDGRFVIQSGAGNDILAGGAGNDTIRGGAGTDQLFGLDGNDILVGGAGADALRGGLGADRFVYESTADSAGNAVDRIRDFQKGADRIDLSAIDAMSGTATNEGFTFIGTNVAFGKIAGELRVVNEAGQWFVQGDVDGDGAADLVIRIDNGANVIFASSDFVL